MSVKPYQMRVEMEDVKILTEVLNANVNLVTTTDQPLLALVR